MSNTNQSQVITFEYFLKRYRDTKKPTGGKSEAVDRQVNATHPPFSVSAINNYLNTWNDILKSLALENHTLFTTKFKLKNDIKQKIKPTPADNVSGTVENAVIPSIA